MVAVRHDEVTARAPQRHLRAVPASGGRAVPPAVLARRQVVAGVVVALVVVLVAQLGGSVLGGAVGGDGPPALEVGTVHVVQPGDTYWSLAGRTDHGGDVTAAVDALVAANGDRALQVGDRIALPG